MCDFAARANSNLTGTEAKTVAADFAVLVKAVEIPVNDVQGELLSI